MPDFKADLVAWQQLRIDAADKAAKDAKENALHWAELWAEGNKDLIAAEKRIATALAILTGEPGSQDPWNVIRLAVQALQGESE